MAGFWPVLKQSAGSATKYAFAGNVYYVGADAPVFGKRVDTVAAALALLVPKDVLILGPQRHTEGNLILPAAASNVTIIGDGNRGASFIEPSAAGDEGLQVLANDVTLINVGVAGGSSSSYALNVNAAARFRAYGCKFEGPTGPAVLLNGTASGQVADLLIDDCEFAWCGTGIRLASSGYGVVTTPRIRNSWFHNFTAAGLDAAVAGDWVTANLALLDNTFDQQEDGTEPTDFILLSSNSNTGIIAGNRFALATNDAAKLTIGTGLMWVNNSVELTPTSNASGRPS